MRPFYHKEPLGGKGVKEDRLRKEGKILTIINLNKNNFSFNKEERKINLKLNGGRKA